jgi:hypothetical protein
MALFNAGLCDRDTGIVYPNAETTGTLSFSTAFCSIKGPVPIRASSQDGWSVVSCITEKDVTCTLQFDMEATASNCEMVERQVNLALQPFLKRSSKASMGYLQFSS